MAIPFAFQDLYKETRNVGNREPNQCALMHLASGTKWKRMKRQQGIPDRKKALLEVGEWRQEAIEHANEAMGRCGKREYLISTELRSLAHEVASDGHDRDRSGVSAFFRALLIASEINVGVFDIRIREGGDMRCV